MNLVDLSKEISYSLRHAPWEFELELDEQGFVPIAQLLHALNESGTYEREVTQADLEQIRNNAQGLAANPSRWIKTDATAVCSPFHRC